MGKQASLLRQKLKPLPHQCPLHQVPTQRQEQAGFNGVLSGNALRDVE
jgi:hypothetical protein